MPERRIGRPPSRQALLLLGFLCGGCALLALALALAFGSLSAFDATGLATASRTLNQFTAVVLTCIALIIPLTANLYTPKLVRLYTTHPILAAGLVLLLLSHTLAFGSSLFPKGSATARALELALALCFLLVMAGALPFLFAISQFLRPSYFVPMLTRKGIHSLRLLDRRQKEGARADVFETVDVVTNLALTGMGRGDRQLVLLSLQSFHALLMEVIGTGIGGAQGWRARDPRFVPGLAREGQEYLTRHQVWPEAYLLAQMLKVMEVATRRQHELLAELAGHLVESARLAVALQRDQVVELHLMAFNTLMREAVEASDLRRFQNLSYHDRLLIECLHAHPERMNGALMSLLHFARSARRKGLAFAFETVVYDLGELVLSLGRLDSSRALELLQVWAGPLWQECLEDPELQKAGWKALLRAHWEARAAGMEALAEAIRWRFLLDATIHRERLEALLDENRALHYEFNDRLMRFAHLSEAAEGAARAFACEGELAGPAQA